MRGEHRERRTSETGGSPFRRGEMETCSWNTKSTDRSLRLLRWQQSGPSTRRRQGSAAVGPAAWHSQLERCPRGEGRVASAFRAQARPPWEHGKIEWNGLGAHIEEREHRWVLRVEERAAPLWIVPPGGYPPPPLRPPISLFPVAGVAVPTQPPTLVSAQQQGHAAARQQGADQAAFRTFCGTTGTGAHGYSAGPSGTNW